LFPSRGDAGPEDLWRKSLERPGGERKLVRKYGAFGLLVVDEWLLDRPDTEFRSMLMELRFGTASTVFCTQFKNKDWHPRLGGRVHADAIMEGSCTTRSGPPWARPTCGSAADRPVAIKKHRGQCRPRCPSAISAVPFRDIRQCSSEQILSHIFRKWGTGLRVVSGSLIWQESVRPSLFSLGILQNTWADPRFCSGGIHCCFA